MTDALKEAINRAATILHAPLKPLPANGSFDLGNRTVFFTETPGHTPGCIVLGDEKTGILFSGDSACCKGVLLAFDHSCSVTVFLNSIREMKRFMAEHSLTAIYPSHHETGLSTELLDQFEKLCTNVISGSIQGTYQDIGTCAALIASFKDALIVYSADRF